MTTRQTADGSLVRALGIWGLAASIVNLTIGGGIFRLPASAASIAGASAPIAYFVCAFAMGLIVLCFAEAGSRVSLTGGLYAYVEVAFGPLVGFVTGVMLWAAITAAMAAVASFFADALGELIPALAAATPRAIVLIATIGLLAMLNIAGVRGANRFNVFITATKLLPLLLLIAVGLPVIRSSNLVADSAPSLGVMARTSTLLLFAFMGVESALVPSGEVKDSSRTVPRAIFLAMVVVTLLYLAIQVVTQGILGSELAGQKAPLAEAAAVALGAPGRTLILLGMAISMFGHVSGMTLSVPRMLFAFGRDGFLPSSLARVHERFHTPYVAIVVQAIITAALAVSGQFETLAIVATGGVLLVYGACCIAVLELRRRNVQQSGVPFRAPLAGAVPILAVAVIVWLLASLQANEWKALLIVLTIALVIYGASHRSRASMAARPEA